MKGVDENVNVETSYVQSNSTSVAWPILFIIIRETSERVAKVKGEEISSRTLNSIWLWKLIFCSIVIDQKFDVSLQACK